MAGPDRRPTSDLKHRLLREGPRFAFIQAMRLLRRIVRHEGGPGGDGDPLRKRIRVRPHLSLDFPETDLTAIDALPGDPDNYRITATFLCLYGSASPLPTFYTEDLLAEQADDQNVSREFLDVINAPLYPLFFQCWGKYRLSAALVEEQRTELLERFYALLGLSGDEARARSGDAYVLLRYAGLATHFPRSAEGLRALLADRLGEPGIAVQQCVARRAEIPADQRLHLGVSGNRLGDDSVIGAEVDDAAGMFRLKVGPLSGDRLQSFLPDQPRFREMQRLIRYYLDQPLAWDVEVSVPSVLARPVRLGDSHWGRLGWNTWTFSGNRAPGAVLTGRWRPLPGLAAPAAS
jgi:type VI secretion system protein ImpH